MKRLSWLVGFTIAVLAMPAMAFAGGNDGGDRQREEKRIEIRVEREGDVRMERRDRQHDGERGEWRDSRRRGEMLRRWAQTPEGGRGSRWEGMHGQAMRMFRGIRDRAMNIHFQPQVEDSMVAIGFGNKNIQAETLNININIGDVSIAGNSLEGGDAGEVIGMLMEMMGRAHGQAGPGGPGMRGPGGPGGPGMQRDMPHHGNNGPGPRHDRFDGSRPPAPGMPPHGVGNDEWQGRFMRWHEELMRHPEAHEFMDGDWHQRLMEMHEQGMGGEDGAAWHELFQRWHEEMMQRPDAHEMMDSDWHRRLMEMHHQEMGGAHGGMHGDEFFGGMSGGADLRRLEFIGKGDDGLMRRYEVLIEDGKGPVPPGEVRSPYHDFYFGEHRQPRSVYMAHPPVSAGMVRPEIMELMSNIPEEVPTEYVEMIMLLGKLAWEDEGLRRQLEELVHAHMRSHDGGEGH